jgi:S-methylmethionine-dependent homocysteine/selenocysteine methylase
MKKSLESRLAEPGLVLLDGATGTELERRGFAAPLPLWTGDAAIRAADLLLRIHSEYLAAGADVLTANTFRTSPYALRAAACAGDAAALTRATVAIARAACAAAGRGLVAGSVAPLEDCFHPERTPGDAELQREHAVHIHNLADAGVDLLLLETMSTGREALIAARLALETGLPVLVSVILDPADALRLLSGEALAGVLEQLGTLEVNGRRVAGRLVNCTPVQVVAGAFATNHGTLIGAFPNAGHPQATSPAEFAAWGRSALPLGARILGGCCGTTPDHIRALASLRMP